MQTNKKKKTTTTAHRRMHTHTHAHTHARTHARTHTQTGEALIDYNVVVIDFNEQICVVTDLEQPQRCCH